MSKQITSIKDCKKKMKSIIESFSQVSAFIYNLPDDEEIKKPEISNGLLQCTAKLMGGTNSGKQCSKTATTFNEGKPYCSIHSKKKDIKKNQDIVLDKQYETIEKDGRTVLKDMQTLVINYKNEVFKIENNTISTNYTDDEKQYITKHNLNFISDSSNESSNINQLSEDNNKSDNNYILISSHESSNINQLSEDNDTLISSTNSISLDSNITE